MNRIQKISWLMVICIGTGVVLSAIAATVLYFKIGFPRAWSGLAFLGLSGFGGLGPAIFKKDPGPVQADERDRQINYTATRISFTLSYLVFGVLCMGIWAVWQWQSGDETISIHVLPLLFGAAGLTAFFTHALTILILYGKGNQQPGGEGQ